MSECRDWLKTLWSASYKGVPFYFESDEEEGGRDQVVHVFPHRDDPFVEDMGEAPRYFSGTAYVHGDDADAQAVRFAETLATRGAGTLTVPIRGPILVQAMPYKRRHERDRLGYVAFEVKFVREGAFSAIVSIGSLRNEAFGAIDRMTSALAALFPRTLTVARQPDYVVAAAVNGIEAVAATVDAIRTSYPVNATVSASVRDRVADMMDLVSSSIDDPTEIGSVLLALAVAARNVGEAMPAGDALRAGDAMLAMFNEVVSAPAYLSTSSELAGANAASALRLGRLLGLVVYADAVLRAEYVSRPDGVTARGNVAQRFEAELYSLGSDVSSELYLAIDDLRARVIDYLSHRINDLAPVITIETARMLPSLFLAWRLYADPGRSDELVGRNRVVHPSFMPQVISALSR